MKMNEYTATEHIQIGFAAPCTSVQKVCIEIDNYTYIVETARVGMHPIL